MTRNAEMYDMMQILRDLTPVARTMCSSGYERAVAYLREILPFEQRTHRAADGDYNGWMIPPKWDVIEATIRRGDELIYDGSAHPLGVIALSTPFEGRVARDDLRRHLHYDDRYPDSLTYHFRQQFRSWDRTWGFCVPQILYDALAPGDYDVRIVTRESEGALQLLDYEHRGTLPYVIALNANLDHPGVANDGLAGVVVGIEVMRRLRERRTRLGYRLVLTPGIVGSEYYLGGMSDDERSHILECLCLWMLGSDTGLALQASRDGRSNIEHALAHALDARNTPYRQGEFEGIIINDEYLWEAYGIPTCSLSRFPYAEYHSSRDNCSIMRMDRLEEAVTAVLSAIEEIEATPLVEKRFEGTICLSNPDYDLYVDPGQVAFGHSVSDEQQRLRRLQDYLPSLRRPTTVRRLAAEFGLADAVVLDYLRRWEECGLIELH